VTAARAFAALLFLACLSLLVLARRSLRERARAEAADDLLRQAFEGLDRDADPPEGRASRSG
jgi:hypothetical protein